MSNRDQLRVRGPPFIPSELRLAHLLGGSESEMRTESP